MIGIGFIIGGLIGSNIAIVIPAAVLKKGFAILMIIVACRMLFLK
ncbi:MAG: hypothetical protein LBV66_02190 [Elusimicrobiota bacterium]|nr:hypothetical protein [Elusimicrobiota bacterium]